MNEGKSTCCGRCGHSHVKGTSCPKPYLTGKSHCKNRMNEETYMDKQVRSAADTKPELVYYIFYKGQFEVVYGGTFGINRDYYWDKLKVRRPKGSQFKLNPEFIIVSKKDYDQHPENYTQLKPYVDQYWSNSNSSKNEGIVDETDEYCPSCLKEFILEYKDKIEEAEYRGRKVKLGKPFLTPGGPKKRSVYVKNAKGNVVKVNFGDPNMKIKKNIPSRRKSFRARHKCDSPGPRWKARYWSCKAW